MSRFLNICSFEIIRMIYAYVVKNLQDYSKADRHSFCLIPFELVVK